MGGVGRPAEQPPAVRNSRRPVEEISERDFLRYEPDDRRVVVAQDVVAATSRAGGLAWSANDADERGLARAVGAEQGEDLALGDGQVYAV